MSNSKISIVILAAGKGRRMYSDLPKVLHVLAGKPMVQYVIDTAMQLNAQNIHLVYGYGGDLLKKTLSEKRLNWVFQSEQLGTGHAVQQAAPYFSDDEDVLLLYGDVPMISTQTLNQLIASKPESGISLLTVIRDNPSGYGRILRENSKVAGVIEHKDASKKQRKITEINTGILVANGYDLKCWLDMLKKDNAQGEYYITDIVALAHSDGKKIEVVHPINPNEVRGINNCLQLAELERLFQLKQSKKLLLSGVMLLDPLRFNLRGELYCGRDVSIDANVIIEGAVKLGDRVKIGIGCVLKNCEISDDCEIKAYSVLEGTALKAGCIVGPFAHLRPGTQLASGAQVGNFVEMKKAHLGKNSKAGHLSYIGNAEIGNGVNIGAGTITCNYDGANKHKTIVSDGVFIGSDSQLVAPVSIGKDATIAAGTTVTHNINENELVLSRVNQKHIRGWIRPTKLRDKKVFHK